MIAGGVICLAAVVLVSLERGAGSDRSAADRLRDSGTGSLRARYSACSSCSSGPRGIGGDWPVAVARLTGTVVAFGACLVTRTRPAWSRAARGVLPMALVSGVVDAAANVCYILATRMGLFGIAVVITALYPGVTVLLARIVFGERMRWVQRAGLVLAGVGLILVTA